MFGKGQLGVGRSLEFKSFLSCDGDPGLPWRCALRTEGEGRKMAPGLRASGAALSRSPAEQPAAGPGKLLSLPVPLFLRWMMLCYCEGPAG